MCNEITEKPVGIKEKSLPAVEIAVRLSRVTKWAVFPCLATKAPACAGGFKAAARGEDAIRALWSRYPGPLVGVPTGAANGVAVLDIDSPRHPEAAGWWSEHGGRLPATFTIRTRSGGLHVYLRHRPGLRCATGFMRIPGLDVRAEGGYVVAWMAHGCPVLSRGPLADWLDWLLPSSRPARPLPAAGEFSIPMPRRAFAGIVRAVATAPEGRRNATLFWATCRTIERPPANLPSAFVHEALIAAAARAGLDQAEAERTLISARRTGGA